MTERIKVVSAQLLATRLGVSRRMVQNWSRDGVIVARTRRKRECSRCHRIFPADHYPPSAGRKGGGGYWCRDCKEPSKRASDMRRRRAKAAAQVVPVSTLLVALRDGWRCGICGRKVTRATWSLDHVEPLSRGGDHTYANVVLAHQRCNSARGAGRLAVQMPLFSAPPTQRGTGGVGHVGSS